MSTTGRAARRVALLAVALLLAAACGGSNFEPSAGGGDGDGGSEAPAGAGGGGGGDAGVELELAGFASSAAEDAELSAIIDAYNEQSSNTASFNPLPEYDTTLQAQLAGGDPPDVFYVNDNRLADLAETGTLAGAEGMIDEPDGFYPNLVEAFTYDGTWYCPAKDFSTLALQYNVEMLEEAGVEPPTTWDELAAAAEQLTTDDHVGLVIAPEWFRWGVFALQAGGDLMDAERSAMTADDPAVREAFTFLQDLHERDVAATPPELDAGWAGEALGLGKAAMTIEGNWIVAAMDNDFPDVEWAVTELPEGPAGRGTFSFSVCYGVAASAPNPEASWDLVNFLVSPEQQGAFTEQFPVMPSREALTQDWAEAHPELQAFIDGAEYAVAPTYVPGFIDIRDEVDSGIQGIATGNREVDDVLGAVQSAGEGVVGG